MRVPAVVICILFTLLSYRDAAADFIVVFDPGNVGQQFTGAWATSQFDLDEPLSKVRFEVAAGKLINLIPNSGQSWRFDFNVSNHGLSQNVTATKSMTFLDSNGGTLFTFVDINTTVTTVSETVTATRNTALSSIAAIEVQYTPSLTQVGPNATVNLSFNNRTANGVLQVTAVPEPSSMLTFGVGFALIAYRRCRPKNLS